MNINYKNWSWFLFNLIVFKFTIWHNNVMHFLLFFYLWNQYYRQKLIVIYKKARGKNFCLTAKLINTMQHMPFTVYLSSLATFCWSSLLHKFCFVLLIKRQNHSVHKAWLLVCSIFFFKENNSLKFKEK